MARGTRARRSRPEQVARRRETEAQRRAQRGDASGARAAWRSAAEAWRAIDRPVAAARALSHALAGGPPDALGSALFAGVLQDVGALLAARSAAEDAVAAAVAPGPRVLALDVLVGTHLLLGELDAARTVLAQLAQMDGPAAELAHSFRRARIDRLDGRLDAAIGALSRVWAELPHADVRFAAPRAAAAQDRAEIYLLQGKLDHARASHRAATTDWERAGRRPGRMAAEGLAVRIALAANEVVLPGVLDSAIRFADERDLRLLGAELRLSRGRAWAAVGHRSAAVDFDAAVAVAQDASAPLLEGRARLWRRVAGCPGPANDVARTRMLLASDRVLSRHGALRLPE